MNLASDKNTRSSQSITAYEKRQSSLRSETADLSLDRHITTVVFDLEHVLCTNIDAIHSKSEDEVMDLPPIKKLLCFGGDDRIQRLQEFLEKVHIRNEEENHTRDNVKCFIIATEGSRAVLQLLMDLGLLKYFVSRFGDQLVSHVIGRDHAMAEETNHMKHLILLKLLQSLSREHDEMLFVGNKKEEIEHFKTNAFCRAYWCETQGLTEEAMNKLVESYFSSDS